MEIYHERQRRMLCAVHTLNNLFQDSKAFSKEDLDTISLNLSPDTLMNPHKNILGLGNYDVNVLMAALQLKDYEAVWFDKRMCLHNLDFQQIFGFVINKPSNINVAGFEIPTKRPHWFAVRKINDNYYNLDSKLSLPQCVGDEEDLMKFLTEQLEISALQLFLVVEKSVAENKSWKRM